jgi:regulator of protease activity HflC (stomatin/prohibitin superfamily)
VAATAGVWISLSILLLLAVITVIATGIRIIKPNQKGLVVVLGSFKGIIDPGFHLVVPMITIVIPVDMRLQNLQITKQDLFTKDGSIIGIDLIVFHKISDPYKAHFEVQNQGLSINSLVYRVLGSVPGNYNFNDILSERELFREELKVQLNEAAATLGIWIEDIELRNIYVIRPHDTGVIEQNIPMRTTPVTGRESVV